MAGKAIRGFMIATGFCALAVLPASQSFGDEGQQKGHRQLSGIVVERAGSLAVKTPDGGMYQLNANRSRRHGHEPPKLGEDVTIVLNENGMVTEIHPKGEGDVHRTVTGNLLHLGKMQKEITLDTTEGERAYRSEEPLTSGIEEGALVTVELNESGSVIDLHRAKNEK